MNWINRAYTRLPITLAGLTAAVVCPLWAPPFTVQGPGVRADDFQVTVFASGLPFPLGMAELPDGSLLVTISEGNSFFTSSGKLIRLVDETGDGVADGDPRVMYDGLSGGLTAVEVRDSLVVVVTVGGPIVFLRMGESLNDPLTFIGQIDFSYPGGSTYHAHSALEMRPSPGTPSSYDLFFQVGSESNFAASTGTVPFQSSTVAGADGVLVRDSAYMMTIADEGSQVRMTGLARIGAGLRNAAGFAAHPTTGDLYFQDNGIDGLENPNEPHSADELHVIARGEIGVGPVPDFGFPDNYTAYRTGEIAGGEGVWPIMVFQPVPDPFTGLRSEGPNDITFAPPGFPEGLNRGLFIGFHGKFNLGGTDNDENPLVYADPETGGYFHFILGQQEGIGHLNGLLATRDTLFVADMTAAGNMTNSTGPDGAIYRIQAVTPPLPPDLGAVRAEGGMELRWDRGRLQQADFPGGPWTDMEEVFSPLIVHPTGSRGFFRAVY